MSDAFYTDDDIELIQANIDADEHAAYMTAVGKPIDDTARKQLRSIADSHLGGSLNFAMTVWLSENGYATSTLGAQSAVYDAIFAS